MQKRLAATSSGTSNKKYNKRNERKIKATYLFLTALMLSTSLNLKIKLLAPDNEFTTLQ